MPNLPISGLSSGASVSATDLFPDVQTPGVGPVKVTAQQIKDFTSTDSTIYFSSGSASAPSIAHVSDTNTGIYFPTNDEIGFSTNGLRRIKIDPTGFFLLGLSQKQTNGSTQYCSIQTAGPNGYGGNIGCFQYTPDDSCAFLGFYKSRGAPETFTNVLNNDDLAEISWAGAYNNQWNRSGTITTVVDSDPAVDGCVTSRIVFWTKRSLAAGLEECMRINHFGFVGIGGSDNPGYRLDVKFNPSEPDLSAYDGPIARFICKGSTGGGPVLKTYNGFSSTQPLYAFWYNDNSGIGNPATNVISFITNNSETFRVASDKRILIGSTTSVSSSSANPGFQINSNVFNYAAALMGNWEVSTAGSGIYFIKSRSGTVGDYSVATLSGDALGAFLFEGSNGTSSERAASIVAFADDLFSAGSSPGRLVFNTTASGSTSSTERMRINSSGNIGIAISTPTAKLDVNSNIIRLRTAKTPSSSSDTGNTGDICWDSSYIYVCVATNTWKRSAIATW